MAGFGSESKLWYGVCRGRCKVQLYASFTRRKNAMFRNQNNLIAVLVLSISTPAYCDSLAANVVQSNGSHNDVEPAADEAIDAGLWRNEYLEVAGSTEQESASTGASKTQPRHRLPHSGLLAGSSHLTTTDVLATDTLAILQADNTSHINDWDKAAANPDTKGRNSSAASGPSLTSYIVGLVSAVVIIGGLVSGK